MTKQEAIAAMKRGEKVTHRFFDPGEYITQKGFVIRTEDGAGIDIETFWNDRCAVQWESDWEIYQEKK
jgi:hypothetical protein